MVAGEGQGWRTGPKEGVRRTNFPFITTGRGQVSHGLVPDSGTKVLHHRVKVVVTSPAWLLGSVHISLFGGKLEHRLVTPLITTSGSIGRAAGLAQPHTNRTKHRLYFMA